MEYQLWREDLFGQSPDTHPVDVELLPETYQLPVSVTLDYIDRSLVDGEIHDRYTAHQIAIGLQQFYCNSCSNLPFCYIEGADEARHLGSIRQLRYLYSNFFERYCVSPVVEVGNESEGALNSLCYMLWDIFVLCPGNATESMLAAGIEVMSNALRSSNDQCIVSALHGLGHWVSDSPAARQAIQGWLHSPTTDSRVVIEYAKQARTGCIL